MDRQNLGKERKLQASRKFSQSSGRQPRLVQTRLMLSGIGRRITSRVIIRICRTESSRFQTVPARSLRRHWIPFLPKILSDLVKVFQPHAQIQG
ncbi:unnamed protein product [Blumeria hordei]|uniref:Uncharacterized protein n=1 Tax=Blumeria hordei TaxID=2867405 RepID=A0A383UJX1_BLUHO|nr:unnamed protein product [Blumeria hordei]